MTGKRSNVGTRHRHFRKRWYDAEAVMVLTFQRWNEEPSWRLPYCAYAVVMDIPDEALDAFIRGWEEEFGETISRDMARSQMSRILDLLLKLAEPVPEKSLDRSSRSVNRENK